jgi:FkbM family methyltransferase
MTRIFKFAVRVWLVIIAASASLLLAMQWHPTRVAAYQLIRTITSPILLLTVRDGFCPLAQGRSAIATFLGEPAAMRRYLDSMKLLDKSTTGLELWETPRGNFWIPQESVLSLAHLMTEWERNSKGTGQQAVSAGDVVLDCGAYVGTYTREALMAGAKLVVAIEPSPENLQCLRRTFTNEILAGRVIICPKGVWDQEDWLTMYSDPETSAVGSLVVPNAKRQVMVPLTTIDKLVVELGLESVDFIKMDIEGAEQRALAGARKTLARFRPRLGIASYHLPDDTTRIPEIVLTAEPAYYTEAGDCVVKDWRIVPETLFFR